MLPLFYTQGDINSFVGWFKYIFNNYIIAYVDDMM